MDEPSEFLHEVRNAASLADRTRALEVARGVFRVLFRTGREESCRAVASLLPEELETVWKPAFFTCLRPGPDGPDPDAGASFVRWLRREIPTLDDEDEARRCVRSVLRALRRRMDAERQVELGRILPEDLRNTWMSA